MTWATGDHRPHSHRLNCIVSQDGSRDCGAACVRAVLQWWYAPHVPPASTLDDAPAAVAAWTVELLAALRQCHVDCALYTTSAVGVSEGHGAMPWYAGESLVADSERVPELFRAARRAGWEIHEVRLHHLLLETSRDT